MAEFGQFGQICRNRPPLAESGQIRAESGQNMGELDPVRPNLARSRPDVGRFRPGSATFAKSLVKSWPKLRQFARHRPKLGKFSQKWTNLDRLWHRFGRSSAEIDQRRPIRSKTGHDVQAHREDLKTEIYPFLRTPSLESPRDGRIRRLSNSKSGRWPFSRLPTTLGGIGRNPVERAGLSRLPLRSL